MPDDDTAPRRARPMWTGTVAFGLVSLPVQLFSATRSARTSLKMVDEEGRPLERRYFSSRDDRVLGGDAIVRGYEVEDGRFVVVEDEELEGLAPEKSQEIDLSRFVGLDEIDPMYFDRPYFLAPDRGALKAYRLLAKSMEEAGRAGIATFVMRDKEYLVAIIAEDGILRAQTLRFADELRSPDDVGLPDLPDVEAKDAKPVERAIDDLAADDLDRSLLRDRERRRLEALVAEKLKAGDGVVEPPAEAAEAPGDEVDLMEVLKRSLAQDEDEGGGDGGPPGDDLEGRTKGELYERAQELEIEGRSGMTKRELIAAIRRAA